MMIKIGFIDYYLDEWHANNYPEFIKKCSDGKYEVCYAYGKIQPPRQDKKTNEQWAEEKGITLFDSIEEVVQKSDVLIVLSPDNPEMHEELCDIPLKSGKPVYIDKTFAPDKKTALKIFETADKYGTKCWSSSALRFSAELEKIDKSGIYRIYSEGPGTYEMYSIHQIEPIITLMQCHAKRVMYTGDATHPAMVIEFTDGRTAHMHQCKGVEFRIIAVNSDNIASVYPINSDYFALFIENLIKFFDTGVVPVSHEQTVDVIAIREAGIKAMNTPFTWVEI